MQETFGLIYQWHGSIYLGGEGCRLHSAELCQFLYPHVNRMCIVPAQLAAGSKEAICEHPRGQAVYQSIVVC